MIITATQVWGCRLHTSDGKQARVRDLLFDDRTWRIEYIVVKLPHLLAEDVLLRPSQTSGTAWASRALETPLSMDEVRAAPALLSNPPVAKQGELATVQMVAWEAYWTGLFDRMPKFGDPHLRNMGAITGHRVLGIDSKVGWIDNFVIDDEDWSVRYLVVRLGPRRNGRRVVVEPEVVGTISWPTRSVSLKLPRDAIVQCEDFVGTG